VAALMSGAPDLAIVPTVIDGSWVVFANNMFPIPYGTRVRVRFGEPIERTPDEDAGEITERCASWAQNVLDEWKREDR
jgi:1-acyl-sn-glycerol-3-phosphate acyltransferase